MGPAPMIRTLLIDGSLGTRVSLRRRIYQARAGDVTNWMGTASGGIGKSLGRVAENREAGDLEGAPSIIASPNELPRPTSAPIREDVLDGEIVGKTFECSLE